KPAGTAGAPAANDDVAPAVHLRLAIDTAGLAPGSLRLQVDNADMPIGPDGLIELQLAPNSPHRIVASASRAGNPVSKELNLTPSPNDQDKPLSIAL
ncbi:MAG TPA: hypothetical protein VFG03_14675, partial [Telluria sp.]|nr:hypothetical protein [Telluria sp.]